MYFHEEKNIQSHDISSEFEFVPHFSSLPSGEISITTKGNKLYLRPNSPYRYNPSPETKIEEIDSDSLSENENFSHQRSATTIINDVAQSYIFIPAIQKTQESFYDDEMFSRHSLENLENFKNSIMSSTIDPKLYSKKKKVRRNSTIFTVSSNSSVKSDPKLQKQKLKSCENLQNFNNFDNFCENGMKTSVVAFCEQCKVNNPTHVIEDVYLGTL